MKVEQSVKRKNKKSTEMQLANPEAVGCDEVEAHMLWDRVGVIKPNPLSVPGGPTYNFSTAGLTVGPLRSAVVVAMASPAVPLLLPTPEVHRPQLLSHVAILDENQLTSSLSGDVTHLESTAAAIPQPPPRSNLKNSARASHRLLAAEKLLRLETKKFNSCVEDHKDHTMFVFDQRQQLERRKREQEATLAATLEIKVVSEQEHAWNLDAQAERFRRERENPEKERAHLVAEEHHVRADLKDKHTTESLIECRLQDLSSLERSHADALRKLNKDLASEKERLQETMVAKLKRTVDDMEALTRKQREQRQERAFSESSRLTAELMQLEKNSKALNIKNQKLMQRANATRRDRELEAQRGELLVKKKNQLCKAVRLAVQSLQKFEKEAVIGADEINSGVLSLAGTIDGQYEQIIRLQTKLDQTRHEAEEVNAEVQHAQQSVYDIVACYGCAVPQLLPLPSLSAHTSVEDVLMHLDQQTKKVVQAVLVESLGNIHESLFSKRVSDLDEDLLPVQNTIVRRLNLLLFSSCLPKPPPRTLRLLGTECFRQHFVDIDHAVM